MPATVRNCYNSKQRDMAMARRDRRNKIAVFAIELVSALVMLLLIPIIPLSFV